MPGRITLKLPPGTGDKEIEIDARRFTIGRIPGNDLVIEDPSLSRRHALIENLDGRLYLSDCGSANGTFINGAPVGGGDEVHDGDELTFGGVGNIIVNIHAEQSQGQGSTPAGTVNAVALSATSVAVASNLQSSPSGTGGTQPWPSAPIMATAAVVLILLIAGLILILANSRASPAGRSTPIIIKKQQPVVDNDNANDTARDDANSQNNSSNLASQTTPDPDASPGGSNNADPGSVELSMLEGYAGKVLSTISRDRQPVLNEKAVREINARVLRYKGSSSLAEQLRAMKRNLPQVSAVAKASGVKTPLAAYATLARMDRDGGGGDVVQSAAQICPALQKLLGLFGQELANDSLLAVAALEEGPGLQLRITKLAGRVNDSPTTIRSIWYLHEHQAISDKTYDFLLRFLAIGVIAQDPQKFGVAAEPLVF